MNTMIDRAQVVSMAPINDSLEFAKTHLPNHHLHSLARLAQLEHFGPIEEDSIEDSEEEEAEEEEDDDDDSEGSDNGDRNLSRVITNFSNGLSNGFSSNLPSKPEDCYSSNGYDVAKMDLVFGTDTFAQNKLTGPLDSYRSNFFNNDLSTNYAINKLDKTYYPFSGVDHGTELDQSTNQPNLIESETFYHEKRRYSFISPSSSSQSSTSSSASSASTSGGTNPNSSNTTTTTAVAASSVVPDNYTGVTSASDNQRYLNHHTVMQSAIINQSNHYHHHYHHYHYYCPNLHHQPYHHHHHHPFLGPPQPPAGATPTADHHLHHLRQTAPQLPLSPGSTSSATSSTHGNNGNLLIGGHQQPALPPPPIPPVTSTYPALPPCTLNGTGNTGTANGLTVPSFVFGNGYNGNGYEDESLTSGSNLSYPESPKCKSGFNNLLYFKVIFFSITFLLSNKDMTSFSPSAASLQSYDTVITKGKI